MKSTTIPAKPIDKNKLAKMAYRAVSEKEDVNLLAELWFDQNYGIQFYFNDNFAITDYKITDQNKFLMFLLKWS